MLPKERICLINSHFGISRSEKELPALILNEFFRIHLNFKDSLSVPRKLREYKMPFASDQRPKYSGVTHQLQPEARVLKTFSLPYFRFIENFLPDSSRALCLPLFPFFRISMGILLASFGTFSYTSFRRCVFDCSQSICEFSGFFSIAF